MSRHPVLTGLLFLALASIAIAGCSSHGDGTAPGDSVLVDGAQHVIWKNLGGGFGGVPPQGASCDLSNASYDLDVGAGSLAWSVCRVAGNDYTDPNAYSTATGSRVLTADERAQAIAATRAVTVSDRMTCGADKSQLTLEVDAASGSIVYGDDFYSCDKLFAHYVDSGALDQLGTLLDGMAHNP